MRFDKITQANLFGFRGSFAYSGQTYHQCPILKIKGTGRDKQPSPDLHRADRARREERHYQEHKQDRLRVECHAEYAF